MTRTVETETGGIAEGSEHGADSHLARDSSPREPGESLIADPISPELVLVSTPDDAGLARKQLPNRADDERDVARDDVVHLAIAGQPAHEEPFAPHLPAMAREQLPHEAGNEHDVARDDVGHSAVGGRPARDELRRRASLLPVLLVAAPLVGVAIHLLTSVLGSLLSPGGIERIGAAATVPRGVDRQIIGFPGTATVSGSPLVLRWTADPRARRYWVDLDKLSSGGEHVVLTLVTEEPHLVVPLTWSDGGHRRRLVAGRYRGYIWPQYEAAATDPRVRLLARAEFVAD